MLNLTNANLNGAHLDGAILTTAVLTGADLSGTTAVSLAVTGAVSVVRPVCWKSR
jgi:uncharacterized protein YjbI with pentapeptide repeats